MGIFQPSSPWGGEPVGTFDSSSSVGVMPNDWAYRRVRWFWRVGMAERCWLKGVSLSCTVVRSNQGKGLGWRKRQCYFLWVCLTQITWVWNTRWKKDSLNLTISHHCRNFQTEMVKKLKQKQLSYMDQHMQGLWNKHKRRICDLHMYTYIYIR